MRLVAASLLIPFIFCARYRGSLRANQCDLNSPQNPFGPDGFFPIKSLGNEQGPHGNLIHNQSAAVTLCATDDSVFCDRQGCSGPAWEYISVIPSW